MRGTAIQPIGFKVYGSINGQRWWLAFDADEKRSLELAQKQGLTNCKLYPIHDDRNQKNLPEGK